ncbi:MAG: hypothetical protein M9939_26935 [Mesorhizobium sp.]|uniref:hypothetical protein n=1 Tax=Aquamicrobium defluvii TaxID=69279 RepID=UPI000449222C|nr:MULTISPECIES: hypothetical protein [Phyllobacteriaceae]EZQ15025.1 hypothetical protein CF98_13485 [Halopseudomonas bauzanensis]MCO5164729.1 hypothetical protein [Mesorhizobium sp.]
MTVRTAKAAVGTPKLISNQPIQAARTLPCRRIPPLAPASAALPSKTAVNRAVRLDQFVLPRWKANEEFQELVTAILRSLPLRVPSGLSSQSLRHLSRLGDGITARVFGILNELAIEAIKDGIERITDESIESWRPALEKEAAFA